MTQATDELAVKAWFCREILPLEPALMRFLRRNWRVEADVVEFRQAVYAGIIEAAQAELPRNPRAYLFAAARNHLVNQARRAQIVSFELVADLETSMALEEVVTPERLMLARDELRQVQKALDSMPPRRREVIVLRKIEGLSVREVAARLGTSISAVEQHITAGLRDLVDRVLSEEPEVRRGTGLERHKVMKP